MSVTDRLMKLGQWSVTLDDVALKDEIDYFDHIVIVPGEFRQPSILSDASILSIARYTGIIREKHVTGSSDKNENLELFGHDVEGWLGDEDRRGFVYETRRIYLADTFANVMDRSGSPTFGLLRDDAGAQTSIHAGTIFSVAGSYTGAHEFTDQRTAIRYVVDVFEAEYRVNPDFTIDLGNESDLFVTTPTTVLARKITDGRDPNFDGLPLANFESINDVNDYSTRTIVLANGSGELIKTGSADAASVPYQDGFGNTVVRVRTISESETNEGNANSRASLHQNETGSLRKALTISTREFDIEGDFDVGDTVYVHDPTDDALIDTANEVRFRGQVLNPIKTRIFGMTWPVREGMSVYIRHGDATYTDVTDSVQFETGGDISLDIGAHPRSTFVEDPGTTFVRVNPGTGSDDATVPAVPAHTSTPWTTGNYLDNEGNTRSTILAQWATPLNTDGSTITDGDRYEIRWRRNGETDYQFSTVAWGTNAFLIQDL